VALTVDRKAFVDTLTEGKGDFGGAMLPPPEACNIPPYRDPAVILIDQLKEIYIDGELDPIELRPVLRRRRPQEHARPRAMALIRAGSHLELGFCCANPGRTNLVRHRAA
jgi:hypothetical protein